MSTPRKPPPPYEVIPGERWLACPGYEDRYEVSDHGRVRTLPGVHYGDRLLRVYRYDGSYALVKLSRERRTRMVPVHRLVALAFLGPPAPDQECRHLNGDRWDPRLVNLSWGTKSENAQDQLRHGTQANALKTHCKQGHEFTPENTYRDPSKPRARKCRTCRRDSVLRFHAARRQVAA